MNRALRIIGGVIAGCLVAFIMLIVVEVFGAIVYPTPPNFSGTMEEMCEHVVSYPQWVLAIVVPAWGATAFAGPWIAKRIGGRGAALSVGMLLIAGVVFNVSKLPYPLWFKVACLVLIPAAVWAASWRPVHIRSQLGQP